MHLVVGLGNPGRKYSGTRHNVGFRVCDRLCDRLGGTFSGEKFSSWCAEVPAASGKAMLLKPQTFMNLSGQSVAEALRFYQLDLSACLVVADDFNLPLGQVRLRRSGSHGGHNGLRNIIELLGHDVFPRLRLGTGPLEGRDAVDFCLTKFRPADEEQVEEMITRGAEAAVVWLERGIDEAMNRFNTKPAAEPEA
jgi:PTH1 family peptidyl-tRNA hydrolase